MPLDGNDSGATWQGPPVSQSDPAHTGTNAPIPAVPQRGYQVARPGDIPAIPAHPTFSDDSWEPSLEDDLPPEPDEQFIPSNITPIRTAPSTTAVPGSGGSIPTPNSGRPAANASLHLTSENAHSQQGGQQPAKHKTLTEQVAYYSSLMLVPFIFAVLTGLIILPFVESSRAYLPSQTFIPLLILLLVIAIAQGVGIFYAGTDNGLWAVCTLTGFFLFVLIGCFALFGALATFALFIAISVLYFVLYRMYVHKVETGFIAIMQSSGQYRRTLNAGRNILLPWEQITHTLSLKETSWQTPLQRVQLSQTEIVVLRGTITYYLDPQYAQQAILGVNNWEESLHAIFVAKLQDTAASLTPNFVAWLRSQRNAIPHDDGTAPFIAGESRWQQINNVLLQQMQSRVSQWGGVTIKEVQVFDVALASYNQHDISLMDEDTAPASYMQQETRTATGTAAQEQPRQPLAQPVLPAQAASPAQPEQQLPANAFKEEVLMSAYRAVQSGAVTDPETIRNLAKRFETVAKNPNLYQNVSFDAMRAALNLYKEADRREEALAARAGTLFNDETNPDFRKPEDESTYFGA